MNRSDGTVPKPNSRECLRQLLASDAILYSTHGQPIVDHAGRPMPWIFYSWAVTLSHEGAALAADCLFDVLSGFESAQLAGIGMTGLPLVSAVVARGLGRYSALYVRDAREKWGTRRQIEGAADRNKPVVVIDDCICSGNSLRGACTALEREGFRVEGAVCLVNFPWKGGVEWARALGYKMETLFDIWTDLEMAEKEKIPGYASGASAFDRAYRVPEGLTPADAARWVAAHYLESGMIPSPPEKLDHEYDATGGVMVSFRDRVSDFRVARNGLYHLDPAAARLSRDVVNATAKTLLSSQGAVAKYGLHRLKLGVTLFSEHVPVRLSELDFARLGILIQSSVQPWKVAGALPNTQFFVSEIEQFTHARFTNARLHLLEPFRLFRNHVSKSIETGCAWPSFGVPEQPSNDEELDKFGSLLIRQVREVLVAVEAGSEPGGDAISAELFPGGIQAIAVTLYRHGMIGCHVSWRPDPAAMIREATAGAWDDKRWKREGNLRASNVDIVVSVLQTAEDLGSVDIDQAAFKLRLGRDSLGVRTDGQNSTLLSYIPCHNGWSKREMAKRLLHNAGISEPPFRWTTYNTTSWLGRSSRVSRLDSGYPRRQPCADFPYRDTTRLLAYYVLGQIGPSLLPDYCYYPISDDSVVAESAARVILALEALMHAGAVLGDSKLRDAALTGLRYCCDRLMKQQGVTKLDLLDRACGPPSEIFLINSVYRSGEGSLIDLPAVQDLAARVRGFFHADGEISWQPEGRRLDSDQDLFPGGALRMAAAIAEVEGPDSLPVTLTAHLAWYRRRFELQHNWGLVYWHIQGWSAIYALRPEQTMASFVYELADWALERQLNKNGAFLMDYAPNGPGFLTGCVMEALPDAWALAWRKGDGERAANYRQAWMQGMEFVDRLIIREEDTFAMRNPLRALGGVRQSLTNSTVRIDYVAHALIGLAKALSMKMVG